MHVLSARFYFGLAVQVAAMRRDMTRSTPLPDVIIESAHLTEIGEILAAGLIRLRARQSTRLSAANGESSVDFPPHRSSHAYTPKTLRGAG